MNTFPSSHARQLAPGTSKARLQYNTQKAELLSASAAFNAASWKLKHTNTTQ